MFALDRLQRLLRHGPAIGAYAAAVLEHPLPWTKSDRQLIVSGVGGSSAWSATGTAFGLD
ncbi:MAG: hypothetical protein JOY78_08200 [Pseudonocardia sp.]|nr:hypothetical protein [Pseudonocardia sp.]